MPLNLLKKRPNIILVTIDTQRYDRLGFNGYKDKTGRETSPYLDSLAYKGVIFRNNICQSNFTVHSIGSLLASVSARQIETNLNSATAKNLTTLAEALKKANYHTFGAVGTSLLQKKLGFGRGFDKYLDTESIKRSGDKTVADLRRLLSREGKREPLFIWYHTYDPHSLMEPRGNVFVHYDAPDKFRLRYRTKGTFDDREKRYIGLYGIESPGRITEQKAVELSDQYDGQVLFADHNIRLLMDFLIAEGLFDLKKDLFVLTSDHGENLGEHEHCCFHNGLYEKITHTPLFMTGAGLPEGCEIDALTMNIDVPPTIADIAGIEFPRGWQGKSLKGLIDGRHEEIHEAAFSESLFFDSVSVRKGRLRYTHRAEPSRKDRIPTAKGLYPTGETPFFGGYPERFLFKWPSHQGSVSNPTDLNIRFSLKGTGRFSAFEFERTYRDGVCVLSGTEGVLNGGKDMISCEGDYCFKDLTSCLVGEDMWNAYARYGSEFQWQVEVQSQRGQKESVAFDGSDLQPHRFVPLPSSNYCALYDLDADPKEEQNLIYEPDYQGELATLRFIAESFLSYQILESSSPFDKMDEKDREAFKALGSL